jgi:GTPase SAR1 family protein
MLGGVECTLQLWDLRGCQERVRFLLPTYSRGAKGAILFVDQSTLQVTALLESTCLSIFRKEDMSLPIILLCHERKMVDPLVLQDDSYSGEEFAKVHSLQGYFKISGKTYEKIDEAFRTLVKSVFDHNRIPYDPNLL